MRIFHTLFLLFSTVCLYGQTYPSDSFQRRMLDDERHFLSRMPADLQHRQMLAVRAAISGDCAALQQIRQSRNQPPQLPDGVTATYPTPDICLISAGHDILFDQTTQLAQRLQRLGHRLTYHVFPTATHLFITVPGQPTAFAEAVSVVARFLNAPADALAEGR